MRTSDLVPIALAGLAGAAMATQGRLNAELGKQVGLAGATFVVHVIATAILAAIVLVAGADRGQLIEVRNARWYTLLGGPLSILILYTVAYSLGKVSTAQGTTGIVVSQLLTASLIDYFGILGCDRVPFTTQKSLAVALIAVGAYILLRD